MRSFEDQGSLGTSSELSVRDITDIQGQHNTNWLCGRTTETLTLLKTYETILQNTNRPLSKAVLVVHGESGSGKTSLVDSLREPVSASHGYFCSGKFFQQSEGGGGGLLVSQEPYSAVLAAFSDLCDLVLQSRDFDNRRRTQIRQALGPDGNLLSRAISNLSPFLDDNNNDDNTYFGLFDTTNKAILTRFKIACRRFLRAMSSERHPIVLFIDDVQWMDDGSRQVIKTLLDDGELQNVLLIFAYRDEEADSIGDLFSSCNSAVDIPVHNLDVRDVQQLVSALLGSPASQIEELTDLVVARTSGNPFHVIQFIQSIQNEELLVYDTTRSMWTFDVCQIKKEMMVSETLCDLLARRLFLLDPAMQVVLKVASLIGYCFAKEVLVAVSSAELHEKQLSPEQIGSTNVACIESILDMAISQGFIDMTKDIYHFNHDKLQASCQEMIEPVDIPRLHNLIGNQYVFHSKNDDALFQAAVHLNKAGDYALGKERRDKLARINLEAAKRCRDKSAFDDAAQFLRHGLMLLDEESQDKWTKCFDLAFELTESLARMELILGNLNACKQRNEELILHSKSVQMKIAPLVIDVEVRMAGNETTETVVAAKRTLRELGVVMPRRVTALSVLLKLRKVRHLLRGKSDDDILGLPLMQDRTRSTAVKVLIHLSLFCLMQDENNAAMYSALCATELTMKKGGGLSPYSANCFTIYGMCEAGLGNIHQGVRYGELAMKLLDRIPCKEELCPVIYLCSTLLLHWKTHFCSLLPVLAKGLSSGFEVGDVVYCSLCIVTDVGIWYMLGENLASLEQFMRTSYSRLRDLGQEAMIMWIQPWLQFILNMRSSPTSWVALTILSGEVMDESEFIDDLKTMNHTVLLRNVLRHKSTLAYHFGYYEMAATIHQRMDLIGRVYESTVGGPAYHFYGAMIYYERYRTTRQMKYLKAARKHLKRLKQFEAVGNPNVSTCFPLLQAEELALRSSDVGDLVVVYSIAMDAMKTEGFVHLEALANERLSVILSALGCHDLSNRFFDRALNLYSDWGAISKYEWLLVQRSLRFNTSNRGRMSSFINEIQI
jgi:histidine kinase